MPCLARMERQLSVVHTFTHEVVRSVEPKRRHFLDSLVHKTKVMHSQPKVSLLLILSTMTPDALLPNGWVQQVDPQTDRTFYASPNDIPL